MLCIDEDYEEVLKRSPSLYPDLQGFVPLPREPRTENREPRLFIASPARQLCYNSSATWFHCCTHHVHNCHPDRTTPTFQFRTSRTFPERVQPAFRQAPLAGISHKANETSREATFRPFQPNEAGRSDKQFDEEIQTPALARKSQGDKGGMPDPSSSSGDIN
jgi:hypothetical protein